MKRYWFVVRLLALTLVAYTCSPAFAGAQEIVKVAAIEAHAYQAMLGKGMDVDWAKTAQGMRFYNAKATADFKARGLRHVRIRVVDAASPRMLNHLHKVVDDSLGQGLIPIIAYRADPLEKDPMNPASQQAFLDWWAAVADSFKDYPPELSFDLIIEVSDELNKHPEVLNDVYARAIPLIRKSNPTRIVMVSPVKLSAPEELEKLCLPEKDAYLMAEWHFYAAGPSRKNPKKRWTDGNPAERKLVLDKIALAKDWQERNVPTWVGAWMANNFNDEEAGGSAGKRGDYSIAEQVEFARFVAGELDRAGIPYAVNSDTKFYDRETGLWIKEQQPVLDAILQPSPESLGKARSTDKRTRKLSKKVRR